MATLEELLYQYGQQAEKLRRAGYAPPPMNKRPMEKPDPYFEGPLPGVMPVDGPRGIFAEPNATGRPVEKPDPYFEGPLPGTVPPPGRTQQPDPYFEGPLPGVIMPPPEYIDFDKYFNPTPPVGGYPRDQVRGLPVDPPSTQPMPRAKTPDYADAPGFIDPNDMQLGIYGGAPMPSMKPPAYADTPGSLDPGLYGAPTGGGFMSAGGSSDFDENTELYRSTGTAYPPPGQGRRQAPASATSSPSNQYGARFDAYKSVLGGR